MDPIVQLLQTPDEDLPYRDGRLKRNIETILRHFIYEMKRILAESDASP